MHPASPFPRLVAILCAFFCSWPRIAAPAQAADAATRHAEADALLSQANYEKVTVGMTSEEVNAILGRPQQGMGTKTDWTGAWRLSTDKSKTIVVHYKNGALDRKSQTMHWNEAPEKKPVTDENPRPAASDKGPSGEKPSTGKKTSASPDEKLTQLLRDAHGKDRRQRTKALQALAKMTPDPQQATSVVNGLMPLLREKDLGVTVETEHVLKNWLTRDSDEPLLKLLEKKPATTSPTDGDRDRLHFAIGLLADLKEPRAVEPLARMLRWSFFDRSAAADALKKLGPELAQEAVLKVANDPDPNVQGKAREILEAFKTSPADKFAQLLRDLKASEPEKRFFAANSLANSEVDPAHRKEIAAALADLLHDNPGPNQALSGKSPAAGPGGFLKEEVKHPAHAAIAALWKWGGAENEPAVLDLLARSTDNDMRYAAMRALEKFGTKKSIPALTPFQAPSDSPLADYAKAAIDAINRRG